MGPIAVENLFEKYSSVSKTCITFSSSSRGGTMRNQRLRTAQNKGGHRRQSSNDFISQMADDVLVRILSLMPIKDAVVTSSLSKRWRFLWCHLIRLNFDGSRTSYKMEKDVKLCILERAKFVKQVCNVVKSYKHPMVQLFRIRFDLDESCFKDIDNWIQFAFGKKVEKLELNLWNFHDRAKKYDFQLLFSDRNMVHLSKLSLKKLYLNGVNVNEPTLMQLLKNSPHLEKLTIYSARLFTHIHVGGHDINLKRFKLVDCHGVKSISLYDFDLESLTYVGREVEFRFTELRKFKELDIGRVSVGLENNVFGQISSVTTSYLQVLILDIYDGKGDLNVNAIPQLTNVKKLMLVIGAEEDDSLLEFTSIAKACPSLETFVISLHWLSPMKRRRKVRHVAGHTHEHLKLVEIIGYYGRISDLELVVYVIENAVSLRKVVIDPICHASGEHLDADDFERLEQAARSAAKRQITPILPRGVDLAIL